MKRILLLVTITILFAGNIYSQSYQGYSHNSDTPEKSKNSRVTVLGNFFGDYFIKAGGDSLGGRLQYNPYQKNFNAFAFRRVNIGFKYDLGRGFDSYFSLSYDGSDTLQNGNLGIYVRDAFVVWKDALPKTNIAFGIMPVPAYGYTIEKWWSYRAVEKTIMDQRGIVSSRDFGLTVAGDFDRDKDFGYYTMVGNGNGNKMENNKYKKIYGTLFGHFMHKDILVSLYSDYTATGPNTSATTLNAFAGYRNENLSFGIENFFQINSNANTSTTATSSDIVPYGLSVFFKQNIIEDELNYFLRYDFFNQDINNANTGFYQSFLVAGLDISPVEDMHIMPNIWMNGFAPKPNQTTKFTTEVVPRITFWYQYK